MSSPPESIAHSFLRAVADHDLDRALALVDPRATICAPPAALSGTVAAEGRAFLSETLAAFPDLQLILRRLFANREVAGVVTVAAEVTFEGTQAADWLGILNQEKHVDVDQVWLLKICDGAIISIAAYWDQNQIYRRLAVKRLDQIAIAVPGGPTVTIAVPTDLDLSGVAETAATAFFDAYRARDVEAMRDLFIDTATFRSVPFEMWGRQRVMRGDGHVATIGKVLWSGFLRAFPDLDNNVVSLAASPGGDVVAEVVLSGTQATSWGVAGMRGGAFQVPHVFLFKVRPDGLLESVTAYWDNADLHRQIGHLEVD